MFVAEGMLHPQVKEMIAGLYAQIELGVCPLHFTIQMNGINFLLLFSEQLAAAFGLISTPWNPMHVFTNLWLCDDCHIVVKFFSKLVERLFVRDATRFCHFKDGVRSCGDYW